MATKLNVLTDDGAFRVLIDSPLTESQAGELVRLTAMSASRAALSRLLRQWANDNGLTIEFDDLIDDRD